MQTKKRAKPVKFGKPASAKTEKKEEVKKPETKVSEEVAVKSAVHHGEMRHPTKETPHEKTDRAEKEKVATPPEEATQAAVDEDTSQLEAPVLTTDETETEEEKDEPATDESEHEGQITSDESTEKDEDMEVPPESTEEEKEITEQKESTETESAFSQHQADPFSKAELAAESSSWKQLILYFFIIAVVAFLLGIAFIGGISYAGKSIKMPSFNFTAFNKMGNTPTKVPIPTATATPEPTPDLSAYSIQILNGSGITGEAAKLKTELTTAGFKVGQTGNADKSDFTKTQISAKTSVNQAYLKKLQDSLQQSYSVETVTPPTTQTEDVIVTIGSSTNK